MHRPLSSPESVGVAKRARIDFAEEPEVIHSPPHDPGLEAGDVIKICMVGSAEELERAIPFPVDYTHQLFEGEMIKWEDGGPDENSDLSIKIVYSSPGFSCWVDWEGVPKCEEERLMVNLSKALPDTRTRSKQAFLKHIEDWKPSNLPHLETVYEYSSEYDFTYTLQHGKGGDKHLKEYHDRIQGIAMWYIETADAVDLMDDRWDVYYLMMEPPPPRGSNGNGGQRKPPPPALLVGFFTVFSFRNPLKGVSLRICQALVLPPEQRKGHARRFLEYLYGVAGERDDVFEVTVEDPAPSFSALRNVVDVDHCRQHNAFSQDIFEEEDWKPLSKAVREGIHKRLKITSAQVEIAFELMRLSTIDEDDEELTKKGRLMVKRRLLRMHESELSADPQQRKLDLDVLYREVELNYASILDKLREY